MFILVEQLKETIKSYTIAAAVANESQSQSDFDYATKLLDQINQTRISLAMQAEMRQMFWEQINVPQASNAASVQNNWYAKNDIAYLLRRGSAFLDVDAKVSLLNQGDSLKVITRDAVNWQQIFSNANYPTSGAGSAKLFDWPQPLAFDRNQALNIAIAGQSSAAGYLFLHGATLKNNVPAGLQDELRKEILNDDGTTKYLPQTQIIPLTFQFPSVVVDTLATDGQGNNNIFTVKNERSVLVLGVTQTASNCRIDKLTDEAKNQTLCERIEMLGVASSYLNPYEVYSELPYPHLLRAGDRFKVSLLQGSVMNNTTDDINVNKYLSFIGITL